jgi:hypothetical protein
MVVSVLFSPHDIRFYSQQPTMSSAPTNPALTQPTQPTTTTTAPTPSLWGGLMMILASLGGLFGFLLHAAAAKLSYDKYQSIWWAMLDFIFGSIYIPYYAFFLNTSSAQPTVGGRQRRR